MNQEIILNFDAQVTPRGRKRSQRDIDRYWASRYATFIKAGFNEKEAVWAAAHGLSTKSRQVRRVLRARKDMVKFYIRHGFTQETAIAEAASDLEQKLERYNVDELNLFYEVSP